MKKPTRKPNMVEENKYDLATPEAKRVLEAAIKAVCTKGDEHGDATASFTMIAELWTTYIGHVMAIRGQHKLDASDVAQLLVMLKISRSAYGMGADNYVDAAGYSALAAMLYGGSAIPEGNDD